MPPFLTPIIIAPGSRCWVLLCMEEEDEEEEDDDDGEEKAAVFEAPLRNSLKHTDS